MDKLRWTKSVIIIVGICLVLSLLSCETDPPSTTNITTTTTSTILTAEALTPTEGILPIKIGLHPMTTLPLGVLLENVTVRAGMWRDRQHIIISGDLNNTTDENYYVGRYTEGYDINWEIVSRQYIPPMLNKTPLFVPSDSVTSFENIMEWAEGVHYLELSFASKTEEEFLEMTEPHPMTPVPESELTRITFSLDWLLENDQFPEPTSVKITFPASWLDEPPVWPEGAETVELVVPTELFETENVSTDPEVIVLIVPSAYFIGYPES